MIAVKPNPKREIFLAIDRSKGIIHDVLVEPRIPFIQKLITPTEISELERTILHQHEEEKKVEDITEEPTIIDYLYQIKEQEYEPIRKKLPNELFTKIDDFTTEIKPWYYIRYRTVAQNLRNIIPHRGLMSYLQYVVGLNITRKVK